MLNLLLLAADQTVPSAPAFVIASKHLGAHRLLGTVVLCAPGLYVEPG